MTDDNAEHLPLDGFWYSARGIGMDAHLRVRHDDCDVIEQYPLSMPTSAIVAAYRKAHPAPDPALAVVLKSKDHEQAFWNSFHDDGGCPWAPESGFGTDYMLGVYTDLETAGLLVRDPQGDVYSKREPERRKRMKYRPTAAAEVLFPKLQAYRKDFPNV